MITPPPSYFLMRDELDMMVRFTGLKWEGAQNTINIEFANYLCLLVYEQARHLDIDLREPQNEVDNALWLKRGRMLSKDLSDGQSVTKHLGQITQFIELQRSAWEGLHGGRRLERLLRRIQPDLGMSFMGSHFVADTSSLAMYSAFPSHQALDISSTVEVSKQLQEFGKFIGASIGSIAQTIRLFSTIRVINTANEVPSISTIDVRSRSVYRQLSKKWPDLKPEVGMLLLGLLSRLRSRVFMAGALRNGDDDLAIAKLEFLTIWSTCDLLRKLVRWGQQPTNNGLPREISHGINSVLSNPNVVSLTSQNRLRNILVHYDPEFTRLRGGNWIQDKHQLVSVFSSFNTVPLLHNACISALEVLDKELNNHLKCSWEWSRQWKLLHSQYPPATCKSLLILTNSKWTTSQENA